MKEGVMVKYSKEVQEMRELMTIHMTPDSDPFDTMQVLMSRYMYEYFMISEKTQFVAETKEEYDRLNKSRIILQSVLHAMNEFAPDTLSGSTEDMRSLLLGANCEQIDFMMAGLSMGIQQGLMWITNAVDYIQTVIGGDEDARTS